MCIFFPILYLFLSFHVLIFFSAIALILLPLLLYFSFFYHCTHTSSITFVLLFFLPLHSYFFYYFCTFLSLTLSSTSSITFVTSLFLPLNFHTSSIAFILHSFFLYPCTFIRNPFIKYFSLFIDTFPFSSTSIFSSILLQCHQNFSLSIHTSSYLHFYIISKPQKIMLEWQFNDKKAVHEISKQRN